MATGFDHVDQNIFTFKHLVHICIQNNEENQNSYRFLGASTTEGNQRHSEPAAENGSRDEG